MNISTLMALALCEYDASEPKRTDDPEIDYSAEYELIKLKKSKLSRAKREKVIRFIEGGKK